MRRPILTLAFLLVVAVPAVAQEASRETLAQGQLNVLLQAQQAIRDAEAAAAAAYATTLLDEAQWRFNHAQANWNADERKRRDEARLRANESLAAAHAALAKSRWLSTVAAVRGLSADIVRLGGPAASLDLAEERPDLAFSRGSDSPAKIAAAQAAVDQAKRVGAPAAELERAQQNIETAKKLSRNDRTSQGADYFAYIAEMTAHRAYYAARLQEAARMLSPLQHERTRVAQAAAERQAAEARAERERAEREAVELQRRLAAEQANREAQASELQRLREEVAANRRQIEQALETDRASRVAAEKRLDALMSQYEGAIASAAPSDVEALRRQVEDQQIALRAVLERERLADQMMTAEIEGLRAELERSRSNLEAETIREREAEIARRQAALETLRREQAETAAARAERERQQQAAIADAQRRREELEAQTEQMRQQVAAAQEAARAAQQSAEATQAELGRMREQLNQTEAEARRLRMQQELSALATTRADARGLIVTLPGIFFDIGKSQLKAGARNTLRRIAENLKSREGVRIAVEGHTDATGSDEANQKLSEARAAAVRAVLVEAGIAESRITSEGRGESQPIATNNTAAGRQQNRRVELVINE